MRVEMNQMLYDDHDPRCKLILSMSNGQLYAFVQCIDRGMDLEDQHLARYWGAFTHADPESSVREILAYGGKWPALPID